MGPLVKTHVKTTVRSILGKLLTVNRSSQDPNTTPLAKCVKRLIEKISNDGTPDSKNILLSYPVKNERLFLLLCAASLLLTGSVL